MVINALYIILGAIGATIKEIQEDGGLAVPRYKDGKVILGFVGSALVGSVTACIADNDPLTAITSGYMGMGLLTTLLSAKRTSPTQECLSVEQQIRQIAKEEVVDPDLCVKVAKCESGLNPKATNTNTDGSIDRGIYQINNKYHPEVSQEQAFDVEFSTRFFCKAFKEGHLSWWNASKTCWGA